MALLLPLAVSSGDWGFDIEGRPRVNGRKPGSADSYVVTPGYIEALRIPIVSGRGGESRIRNRPRRSSS